MNVIYTKHVQEKLLRKDIKAFKINKRLIENFIKNNKYSSKTKSGEEAIICNLNSKYILRIIYVIMKGDIKVITFHVARSGRYEK